MKLIVFDMDGTLIDSHAFITEIMKQSFLAEGLTPPTGAQGRDVIGLSLPIALGQLSGLTGDRLETLTTRYRTLFQSMVDLTDTEPLYDGAREAVLALSAAPDTALGIATGKALRGVERILARHDLADHFPTRQTPDNNPSKPHPSMLFRAMAETGATPAQTIMIGDSIYDIEMARAAGTRAIGVSWGSHPANMLINAGAHLIIDDYASLPAAIDSALGLSNA